MILSLPGMMKTWTQKWQTLPRHPIPNHYSLDLRVLHSVQNPNPNHSNKHHHMPPPILKDQVLTRKRRHPRRILHHESFSPRVPLKLHSRHLLHVISIHRLYAALLTMKLHQELAVRFTQENVFTASPAVTHTLCALSDLMHLLLTQGSHLTVPPTAIYSSQATAMTYVLMKRYPEPHG